MLVVSKLEAASSSQRLVFLRRRQSRVAAGLARAASKRCSMQVDLSVH